MRVKTAINAQICSRKDMRRVESVDLVFIIDIYARENLNELKLQTQIEQKAFTNKI